jgi:hypothetical protein
MRNLRYIQLDNTRITDAGLMRLEELKGLDSLSLGDTQITNDGIIKLKKALPNTSIGGVGIPLP